MAHNLNSMMYTGAKPWHGLGTKLDNVATAEEAIKAASLDWKVTKEPIYLKDGREIGDKFATVREDTKDILGIVGHVYRPLQNKEAFSFFDAVVGSKDAIYHTAGALGVGERIWILAKLPGEIQVIGEDVTEKYLLLTNTHDGSGAINMMFTPIRVVCQNTLNVAMRDNVRKQSVRHTGTMGLRVADVAEGLGIIHQRFEAFGEAARALTKVQVNIQGWEHYAKNVGLIPNEPEMSTRAKNILEEVSSLFEYGKGNNLPGVKGTAWAAFNAVTEYVDHVRTAKGSDSKLESRANSLLFGSGAALKQKAWDKALQLV